MEFIKLSHVDTENIICVFSKVDDQLSASERETLNKIRKIQALQSVKHRAKDHVNS